MTYLMLGALLTSITIFLGQSVLTISHALQSDVVSGFLQLFQSRCCSTLGAMFIKTCSSIHAIGLSVPLTVDHSGQPSDQVLIRLDVLRFGADFIFYMYHQFFIPEARKNRGL